MYDFQECWGCTEKRLRLLVTVIVGNKNVFSWKLDDMKTQFVKIYLFVNKQYMNQASQFEFICILHSINMFFT